MFSHVEPPFKTTKEIVEEAEHLWNCFSAIMESTCNDFETLEPFLRKTQKLFEKIGEAKIAEYINYVTLKGADARQSEWDNIRCCLHLVYEPDSGGALTVDEIRAGKFENNRGKV
jgi:hypothetical protein